MLAIDSEDTYMNETVAIVGLGYVGLPLAVAFGSRRRTIGFDLNEKKLGHYRRGVDPSGEVTPAALVAASQLEFTSDPSRLGEASIIIVVVPTPIDQAHRPDLSPLEGASRTVALHMRPGTTVIYESTVYPGCTEEVCVPILEKYSGLPWSGRDGVEGGFYVGYSPERINPGDKEHRLETIIKVVSGDTPQTLDRVADLYSEAVQAGVHRAASVKVAEAAKVIENTQRDLNIALMNELALIFNRLDIDTLDVLEAAGTKWNFLPFRPGLVGGHCIGVDPYYLTHKAQEIGYHPEIILAGRRINDSMGSYVAAQVVKLMTQRKIPVVEANILVLGLTFKENCPDIRNTRVVDILDEFRSYHAHVQVHDPWADPNQTAEELNIQLLEQPTANSFDAIILAVAHEQFRTLGLEAIRAWGKPNCVLYDIKHIFPRAAVDGRL